MHNSFLVYLSVSTSFGLLWVHHQEKQQCLCGSWYLLFCVDNCLVCRVEWIHSTLHNRQLSIQNNKYQVSHKHSCTSWWWAQSRPKHVEIDKYTKNELCTKLVYLQDYTEIHGQQIIKFIIFSSKLLLWTNILEILNDLTVYSFSVTTLHSQYIYIYIYIYTLLQHTHSSIYTRLLNNDTFTRRELFGPHTFGRCLYTCSRE